MKKNMGRIDRTVRLIAAAVFAVLVIGGLVRGTLAVALGIVAVVFVVTSLVGFCVLYVPFGLCTVESKKHDGPTRIDPV